MSSRSHQVPSTQAPSAPGGNPSNPSQMQRRPSRRKSRSRRLVAGHGGNSGPLPEMEQFGRLFDKVTTSLKNLEFTRDFLRAMIDHSRSLDPIVQRLLDKQRRLQLRFSVVDTSIQDYWRNTSEYGMQMANELEEQIMIPMEQFFMESKQKQKELMKENAKTRKLFGNAQKDHIKQKQVCERMWSNLDQAIQTNNDLHKRNRNPKPLRKPQEQCFKAFMRMEDLTRNLNKLERDNHRQCCEMGKLLSQSQQLAAIRLKAHCDTAQYRADVLNAFTGKISPIVARKAPSEDQILWTWVSYPKNHHTGLPCLATDVVQKSSLNQRFEVRAQPDYQQSEFLNPPENAELPPGMRRVNVRAATPEPQPEEKTQVPAATSHPQQSEAPSLENAQEQSERKPSKRRRKEREERKEEPGGEPGAQPGAAAVVQPSQQAAVEPGGAAVGGAANGFGGDWGDFGDDDWETFDQTPGGPGQAAPVQEAPPQPVVQPVQQQQPPPAAKQKSAFDMGNNDDFGWGDDDDGFDFPEDAFDATPGGPAPAAVAVKPAPVNVPPAAAPNMTSEPSMSSKKVIKASGAAFDDFDFSDDEDDGFGDDDFEAGFDNAFQTPTASVNPGTAHDFPVSPFSQTFDNNNPGWGTDSPPRKRDDKAPTIEVSQNLSVQEQERRLDSPDPMAGGIVRFDNELSTTEMTQTGDGFDFDADFESSVTREETTVTSFQGDPFSSFTQSLPQNGATTPEINGNQKNNNLTASLPAGAAFDTPDGFGDFGDSDFDDFESGFNDAPAAQPVSQPAPAVFAPVVVSPPVDAPVENAPAGGDMFGDMMSKMQSAPDAMDESESEVEVTPQPAPVQSNAFDVTPGGDDDFGFGDDPFGDASAAPAKKEEAEAKPAANPFAMFMTPGGPTPGGPTPGAPAATSAPGGLGMFGAPTANDAPPAQEKPKPEPVVEEKPPDPALDSILAQLTADLDGEPTAKKEENKPLDFLGGYDFGKGFGDGFGTGAPLDKKADQVKKKEEPKMEEKPPPASFAPPAEKKEVVSQNNNNAFGFDKEDDWDF